MPRIVRMTGRSLVAVACVVAWAGLALAAPGPCDPDAFQTSGAEYRICMPEAGKWNGDLIVWAHGYVNFTEPVGIPEDQMVISGIPIGDIATALGFGFAATSYSVNGLAVKQGIEDILDLVEIFKQTKGEPNRVFLIGASEGGLITTLALEQYPDVFAAGCALCGPIGGFHHQINYFGDARVLFDLYYPGLIPGDSMEIPTEAIENWDTIWNDDIKPVIFAPENLAKTQSYVSVAKLAYDANDYWPSVEVAIHDALWYSVFGTNDATEKLGGLPYDNSMRYYTGSGVDGLVNYFVKRYTAAPEALTELGQYYNTTGQLTRPLVTMHTIQDQQVPYWHEYIYTLKTIAAGTTAMRVNIPINRFEHCNFTVQEGLLALIVMVNKATQQPVAHVERVLPTPVQQAQFKQLATQQGAQYKLK